jgi:transcriptional regulator with XRE-family HTH domain
MALDRGFYESLGRRIQARRNDRGITQEALGKLLVPTVTRAAIANMEAGKQGILSLTLFQIARHLNVEVSDLLPQLGLEIAPTNKQMEVAFIEEGVPRKTSRRLAGRTSRTNSSPTRDSSKTDQDQQLEADLIDEGLPQSTSRRLAGRLSRVHQ